jgi:hypothetical protein
MARAALIDFLPDFGSGAPHGSVEPPVAVAQSRAGQPAGRSEESIAVLIAQAVERAEAELEARLTLEHRTQMEAERQAHADEARMFLESLGADMGQTVAAGIQAMEARVSETIGLSVARTIGGMLNDELRTRSLAKLADTIRRTVADPDAARFTISGPLSLFEPLKASLGSFADNLHFVEAPTFDLTVVIDDTVFETRMSEWSAALSEVLS